MAYVYAEGHGKRAMVNALLQGRPSILSTFVTMHACRYESWWRLHPVHLRTYSILHWPKAEHYPVHHRKRIYHFVEVAMQTKHLVRITPELLGVWEPQESRDSRTSEKI